MSSESSDRTYGKDNFLVSLGIGGSFLLIGVIVFSSLYVYNQYAFSLLGIMLILYGFVTILDGIFRMVLLKILRR